MTFSIGKVANRLHPLHVVDHGRAPFVMIDPGVARDSSAIGCPARASE